STQERTLTISRSMEVNAGYETLKSPLKRAKYLLTVNGIKEADIKPSNALLMEIMELREALAEAESKETLAKLEADNTNSAAKIVVQLSSAFKEKNLPLAAELVTRLSYVTKIADE